MWVVPAETNGSHRKGSFWLECGGDYCCVGVSIGCGNNTGNKTNSPVVGTLLSQSLSNRRSCSQFLRNLTRNLSQVGVESDWPIILALRCGESGSNIPI